MAEYLKRVAEILESTEEEALEFCGKVWACPQYRATPSSEIAKALGRLGVHAPIEEVAKLAASTWQKRRGISENESDNCTNIRND